MKIAYGSTYLYIISYFLFFYSHIFGNSEQLLRPHIILNALDPSGVEGALWFIDSLKIFNNANNVGNVYFFHHAVDTIISKPTDIGTNAKIYYVSYNNTKPLPDLRIGTKRKRVEYVTKILSSWIYMTTVIDDTSDKSRGMVISISFLNGSIPVATSAFNKIIDTLSHDITTDIFLLAKTSKLTSLSDWHDLSIAAFKRTSPHFIDWLHSFRDIYYYYASNRIAYSMIEPRIAMLEAIALHGHDVKIDYFTKHDICSVTIPYRSFFSVETKQSIKGHMISVNSRDSFHDMKSIDHGHISNHHTKFHNHHKYHKYISSRCHHLYVHQLQNSTHRESVPAIEMYCGITTNDYQSLDSDIHACTVLELPTNWKEINRRLPMTWLELADKGGIKGMEDFMDIGILRFRHAEGPYKTRPFCWEDSKSTQEDLAASRIEYNASYSIPFTHPDYMKYKSSKSKIKAIIMVGLYGNAKTLDKTKFFTISKMYYARRHNYDFIIATSNEVLEYYPKDLYKGLHEISDYFSGIMTKPLMMLEAMYMHLEDEWLIWTDDDVYVNTGWLYMPLDAFLDEVPSDKVVVMANYRSAFTNILAIRNNHQGRKLMMDWIAITMSGYIQCHGYDQAALALLIGQRTGNYTDFPIKPLGFSCIYSQNGSTGCNSKGDWSCDFKFERMMHYAGFKSAYTTAGFFGGYMSSFSKGCANGVISDFHVLTETTRRPRLQCGLCTRQSEIDSSGHWDGPLGGGNLPLLRGKVNGYFFNHKSYFLFYESYLRDNACIYIPEFIPPCDHHSRHSHLSKEEHDNTMTKLGWNIIPLADGYAFDLDMGKYCKIVNKNVIEHQKQKTYMKTYPELFDELNKISDEDWKRRYQENPLEYGRSPCTANNARECSYGKHEDGQKRSRPVSTTDSSIDSKFFERENFCETCRKVQTSPFPNVPIAIDCRTIKEEQRDKAENHG